MRNEVFGGKGDVLLWMRRRSGDAASGITCVCILTHDSRRHHELSDGSTDSRFSGREETAGLSAV